MASVAPDTAGMTDEDIRQARRLCFFAHYHPRAIVADYVLVYLRELARAGFTVVVLSTAALPADESVKLRNACAMLIERENVGLDFGGWIEAFQRFSPIEADLLLLANDSVYGPLHDLSAFIDRLTAVPADVYGAVESWEGGPHLQSWFLLLRPSAYRSEAFRALMSEAIPADMPKTEIIRRYELALTPLLMAQGLCHHAAFSPRQCGAIGQNYNYNPAHILWQLLTTRFAIPFIKIELLRDNPFLVSGLKDWRSMVVQSTPALVPMIDYDLEKRGSQPFFSLMQRLVRSRSIERFDCWPELHGMIINDAANGRYSPLNYWLFRAMVRIAKMARRALRYLP